METKELSSDQQTDFLYESMLKISKLMALTVFAVFRDRFCFFLTWDCFRVFVRQAQRKRFMLKHLKYCLYFQYQEH